MPSEGVELFREVHSEISQKENPTIEEISAAVSKLQSIDFLQFDIDEIKLIQQAKWLPSDFAVNVLKSWMHQQDQLIMEIRGYLVYHPNISKERLVEFSRAIQKPSVPIDLVTDNIIMRIATTGYSKEFVNPQKNRLIFAKQDPETTAKQSMHPIEHLFDNDNNTYFSSQPRNKVSIIISLPPFLKANLTAYTLRGPPEIKEQTSQGGPANWVLQGLNNIDDFSDAVLIDQQTENNDFSKPNAEKTFPVEKKGYFRHFRLINTDRNHQGNYSIVLSKFDISGTLIINND